MSCERCRSPDAPAEEYALQKGGGTVQRVLCASCRDITAGVYPLEAMRPEPVVEPHPEPQGLEPEPEPEEAAEPSPEQTRSRRGRPSRRP